eukprot:TRINITY_DN111846_c0_g1_i1.p1 TRINITY_DN111846_c0_g1~~TRINITY_DN111846_c0_g1_i1.p1  ORF type:complete len:484 (-),score=80.42 TRINITY_DN111846_c0_g1_i1:17-1468(-)
MHPVKLLGARPQTEQTLRSPPANASQPVTASNNPAQNRPSTTGPSASSKPWDWRAQADQQPFAFHQPFEKRWGTQPGMEHSSSGKSLSYSNSNISLAPSAASGKPLGRSSRGGVSKTWYIASATLPEVTPPCPESALYPESVLPSQVFSFHPSVLDQVWFPTRETTTSSIWRVPRQKNRQAASEPPLQELEGQKPLHASEQLPQVAQRHQRPGKSGAMTARESQTTSSELLPRTHEQRSPLIQSSDQQLGVTIIRPLHRPGFVDICTHCQTPFSDDSKYCETCGKVRISLQQLENVYRMFLRSRSVFRESDLMSFTLVTSQIKKDLSTPGEAKQTFRRLLSNLTKSHRIVLDEQKRRGESGIGVQCSQGLLFESFHDFLSRASRDLALDAHKLLAALLEEAGVADLGELVDEGNSRERPAPMKSSLMQKAVFGGVCKHCGSSLPSEAKICKNCGRKRSGDGDMELKLQKSVLRSGSKKRIGTM